MTTRQTVWHELPWDEALASVEQAGSESDRGHVGYLGYAAVPLRPLEE